METHLQMHVHRVLTVPRQDGPVLCSEAVACDAAVRVESDPHCAAVCVDCWRCYVSTEPAGEIITIIPVFLSYVYTFESK